MLDHLQQTGIAAEQVLAEVGSTLDKILLILAVADFAHAPDQQAIAVIPDQAVPIGAPDDFNDVPACAAENCFQLLNDFSVAAHWTVEPLQIEFHNENQIVELPGRAQRNRTE